MAAGEEERAAGPASLQVDRATRPQVAGTVRGTQSFVRTLSSVWQRPSLTLREIAWRWSYGIPAGALLFWQGRKVWSAATGGSMDAGALGLDPALLNDPVGALTANTMSAAGKLGLALDALAAHAGPAARWVVPVLVAGWVVASALGRAWVARAIEPAVQIRARTLLSLQALRTVLLLAVFAAWFAGLNESAHAFVAAPLVAGGGKRIWWGYAAAVIVLSLGLFVAWAAISWVLSIAPLLAMLRGLGAAGSLRAALQQGPLKAKLVEVNLVMGIIRIALMVLAMVFSATPLPFQTVTTPAFLAWWWAGVSVLYVLWSDFFHVVRLRSYLDLWRAYAPATDAGSAIAKE